MSVIRIQMLHDAQYLLAHLRHKIINILKLLCLAKVKLYCNITYVNSCKFPSKCTLTNIFINSPSE